MCERYFLRITFCSIMDDDGATATTASAQSVLQVIAGIRKDPKLRHGFMSGTAVDEVASAFRPKRRAKGKEAERTASRRIKKSYFKHVIGCLSGPQDTHNPTRQGWDALYEIGLGKKWKGHEAASIPSNLLTKQLHALLLSMFPALISTPYELCKLGGPYNNELVVLTSDDHPSQVKFRPHWSPFSLRAVIGNKAQLIIKPQQNIADKSKYLENVHKVIYFKAMRAPSYMHAPAVFLCFCCR